MSTPKATAGAMAVLPTTAALTIEDVRARMLALAEQANLVSPAVAIDYVPAMHRVSFRVVQIDTTLRDKKVGERTYNVGTDTYADPKFCGPGERALTKTGILKIFRAASIDVVESRRVDDRTDPLVAEWRVRISVPELDGGRTTYESTKIIDLRPGSPQTARMTDAQVGKARGVILENAETKALLRAARGALQLRQTYTEAELARPFVVPVLVPDLDMSDPEIKRMATKKALGITSDLYGPERPGRTVTVDGELVDRDTGEVHDAAIANAAAGAPSCDLRDFDEPATAAPPPAATSSATAGPHLCTCPCGCQTAVSPAVAEMTATRRGAVRCIACYPGRAFDAGRHRNLATLRMAPDVTVAEATRMAEEARNRAGGAR